MIARPHLLGALGAGLLGRLIERGWVEPMRGSRVLRITPGGRREIPRLAG